MHIVKILIAALLIGAPVCVAAQDAKPASNAPEVFSGTAQAKNATGGVSGTLEVRINRYTPDFDRKTVEDALRFGGYPKFLPVLRNAPQVGSCTRRRPAVRDPVCAREGRGRWKNHRRGDRPARATFSAVRAATLSRRPDTKWAWLRFGWTERALDAGRWRQPRGCAPTATAACCSTITPRRPSS